MDEMRQEFARMEVQMPAIIAEREQAARYLQTATFGDAQREELIATVRRNAELIGLFLQYREILAQQEVRHAAWKQMLSGFGIAILGALITGVSFLIAPVVSGGTYVLAWGAIAFGLLRGSIGAVRFFSTRQ